MPTKTEAFRVFIASPAGLEEERKLFRDVLFRYNEAEAIPRGVIFLPFGWEDTLGGRGRPQEIINDEVKKCDFFVLLLWDRWGTPPGPSHQYTSGSEEELAIAEKCLLDPAYPMRGIVVFFKAVNSYSLSFPDPQLRKVLTFKKRIESQKQYLYHNIDDFSTFERLLLRHLGAWLRSVEAAGIVTGDGNKISIQPDTPELDAQALASVVPESDELALEAAIRLMRNGEKIEAEAMLARMTLSWEDPRPFIHYGSFLFQDGRFSQAAVMFERALEIAQQKHLPEAEAVSIVALQELAILRKSSAR